MDTLTLTYWQRRRLEQQLRSTRDARVYRRTLAVLEVASGQPVGSVAARLRVTPRAVYHWLAAYAQDRDPAALADADRSGRPTLLGQPQRDLLRDLLAKDPQGLGYPNATWTVPLLRRHLARDGLPLSEDTLRREVRQLRYSWKRPRYRLDPDPELRGKKEAHPPAHQAVAAAERGPGPGRDGPAAVPAAAVVLVARGGTQGGRAVRPERQAVVFGAMNLRTGSRSFLARERQRAVDSQAFLRVLHDRYRGWRVALLLDEDPGHTAKGSVRLAEGFGVELLWLPKRCPELNPMDTLWGQAKDAVCADKQYPSLDEQTDRFVRHLESLSPQRALHTAGVLSDDFWLHDVL